MNTLDFYKGKKVFISGHTGFKGSWLCRTLLKAGAIITGFSLEPPTDPNLYYLAGIQERIKSTIGDIRDFEFLKLSFASAQPEIVIHLAAQPIVRDSYIYPRVTYETNVMGTVNILECIRENSCVKSFLNVTTDKVYKNNEWEWGYRENEPLEGFDPYSNSKSCSELVTHSYNNSFFNDTLAAISTARAGNVIGGGDFAKDRIIPDCVRALKDNEVVIVRNPASIRPYQHVLEPIFAYLHICQKQYLDKRLSGYYNVGPDEVDCVTSGDLVSMFCSAWSEKAKWNNVSDKNAPHEAGYLKLDCSKIKNTLGWYPRWHIEEAIEKTCTWSKAWLAKEDIPSLMDQQIEEYLGERKQ
jgi:CDP-glucose 4,6-dehydratase